MTQTIVVLIIALASSTSLLAAVRTQAESVPSEQLVFNTPQPKEELSKQEMLERLNRLDVRLMASMSSVAEILSQVKDKDSTKVTGGLTVNRLLAQNKLAPSKCSKPDLRERLATCERTKNFTIVNLYCRLCIMEAAQYCAKVIKHSDAHQQQQDDRWLFGLTEAIQEAEQRSMGIERTPLEQYIANSF
jgi:hypothetical protein